MIVLRFCLSEGAGSLHAACKDAVHQSPSPVRNSLVSAELQPDMPSLQSCCRSQGGKHLSCPSVHLACCRDRHALNPADAEGPDMWAPLCTTITAHVPCCSPAWHSRSAPLPSSFLTSIKACVVAAGDLGSTAKATSRCQHAACALQQPGKAEVCHFAHSHSGPNCCCRQGPQCCARRVP